MRKAQKEDGVIAYIASMINKQKQMNNDSPSLSFFPLSFQDDSIEWIMPHSKCIFLPQ